MVHQAGKIDDLIERDKFLNWIEDFEFNIFGLPRPAEVFLLNMPPEKSLELIKNRENKFSHTQNKDIHEKDSNHIIDSYNAACYVSKKYGWFKVDCIRDGKLRTIEDIHEEIYKEVKKHI